MVTIVENVLNLHAVQAAWQDISLGLVLALAVGLDMWKNSIGGSISRLFGLSKNHTEEKDPLDASKKQSNVSS